MSRKKLDIDPDQVAALAFEGASNREIAEIVGCDEITIRRRFVAILTKKRAERRVWLRSLQNQAAAERQPTMLVWLGKQVLGQTDRPDLAGDPPDDQARDADGQSLDP